MNSETYKAFLLNSLKVYYRNILYVNFIILFLILPLFTSYIEFGNKIFSIFNYCNFKNGFFVELFNKIIESKKLLQIFINSISIYGFVAAIIILLSFYIEKLESNLEKRFTVHFLFENEVWFSLFNAKTLDVSDIRNQAQSFSNSINEGLLKLSANNDLIIEEFKVLDGDLCKHWIYAMRITEKPYNIIKNSVYIINTDQKEKSEIEHFLLKDSNSLKLVDLKFYKILNEEKNLNEPLKERRLIINSNNKNFQKIKLINQMTGLYIDISAKQDYIFESNKLKDNIGASFILSEYIFGSMIYDSIEETIVKPILDSKDDFKDHIAFIGGGNALLLFKSQDEAKKFNKIYSKKILKEFPGIYMNSVIKDNFNPTEFKKYRNELIKELRHEIAFQSNYNEPFQFGIEQLCNRSGKPSNLKNSENKEEFISKEANSKILASKDAIKKILEKTKDILAGSNLTFSNKIEEIIPDEDFAYKAIVHIDGNRMGDKFANCNTLNEFIEISESLIETIESVFLELITEIISLIKDGEICIDDKHKIKLFKYTQLIDNKEIEKYVIPFRSIINAADDITFVAHGRLGIYIAELYLKKLAEKDIYACAGVALVHAKFPFYKAYLLAEELTSNAKKQSRNFVGLGSSWLQFYKVSNGFSGTLDQITVNQHGKSGYKSNAILVIGEKNVYAKLTWTEVLSTLKNLIKNWSESKQMQLNDALIASDDFYNDFILDSESKNYQLDNSLKKDLIYEAINLKGFYLINKIESTINIDKNEK